MVARRLSKASRGMALVMVLWLVAAMSLLVAGVVYIARVDVKQTQYLSQRTKMQATLDGAINLAMQELLLRGQESEQGLHRGVIEELEVELNGLRAKVRLVPTSGLIHLGSVSPQLLSQVLVHGLGFEEVNIEQLLQQMAESKQPDAEDLAGLQLNRVAFESVEELMLIPGVNADNFARLKELFYVGPGGGSGINPKAAPPEVLTILAAGDVGAVQEFVAQRQQAGPEDLSLPAGFVEDFSSNLNSSSYRVDARMAVSPSLVLQRRVWVDFSASPLGLPWDIHRREALTSVATDQSASGGLGEQN
ncbi:MAG: type II secretion system protein GspK [Cellvibrionaceae bacterium]|nr:type II secretion system protein GspK [Cellvibrionaceae bacterium]MCV6627078.1 type II secretion system protein GspK [Cellvibrionaceae bacterium]